MKTSAKLFVVVSMLGILSAPVYADVVTTTTTKTVTVRNEAPIYYGPVVEAELEELTIGDFQVLVSNPSQAFDEFREYKKELNDPNARHLYKMKVNRVLTLADFQGEGVSPEVAQIRYNTYLDAREAEAGDSSYVYVYHTPVVRTTIVKA